MIPRSDLKPSDPNILHQSLVDIKNILSFLHIKLSLTKQFAKALSTEEDCFKYFIWKILNPPFQKIKTGIFDDPLIWQFIRDEHLIEKKERILKRII